MPFGVWILDFGVWVWIRITLHRLDPAYKIFPCHADSGRRISYKAPILHIYLTKPTLHGPSCSTAHLATQLILQHSPSTDILHSPSCTAHLAAQPILPPSSSCNTAYPQISCTARLAQPILQHSPSCTDILHSPSCSAAHPQISCTAHLAAQPILQRGPACHTAHLATQPILRSSFCAAHLARPSCTHSPFCNAAHLATQPILHSISSTAQFNKVDVKYFFVLTAGVGLAGHIGR